LGQGEWNDHEHHTEEGVPEEWKNHLMFREDGLEVLRHKGCLNELYGMELENNSRMTFLNRFSMRWELMISGEPKMMPWNLYCWPSWSNYMVNS
jgi:hypothetical protein